MTPSLLKALATATEHAMAEALGAMKAYPNNDKMVAVLSEEAGELSKALIDYDRAPSDLAGAGVYVEAIQAAAMALVIAIKGSGEFDYVYDVKYAEAFTPFSGEGIPDAPKNNSKTPSKPASKLSPKDRLAMLERERLEKEDKARAKRDADEKKARDAADHAKAIQDFVDQLKKQGEQDKHPWPPGRGPYDQVIYWQKDGIAPPAQFGGGMLLAKPYPDVRMVNDDRGLRIEKEPILLTRKFDPMSALYAGEKSAAQEVLDLAGHGTVITPPWVNAAPIEPPTPANTFDAAAEENAALNILKEDVDAGRLVLADDACVSCTA